MTYVKATVSYTVFCFFVQFQTDSSQALSLDMRALEHMHVCMCNPRSLGPSSGVLTVPGWSNLTQQICSDAYLTTPQHFTLNEVNLSAIKRDCTDLKDKRWAESCARKFGQIFAKLQNSSMELYRVLCSCTSCRSRTFKPTSAPWLHDVRHALIPCIDYRPAM